MLLVQGDGLQKGFARRRLRFERFQSRLHCREHVVALGQVGLEQVRGSRAGDGFGAFSLIRIARLRSVLDIVVLVRVAQPVELVAAFFYGLVDVCQRCL